MPEQDLQEVVRDALKEAETWCNSVQRSADRSAAELGRAVVAVPQGDHHVRIKDVYARDQKFEGAKEVLRIINAHLINSGIRAPGM
jgi:hypothetical protein